MLTKKDIVINRSLEILEDNPDGIRYSQLAKLLIKSLFEISPATIHSALCKLETSVPNSVYKPTKGLFRLTKFQEKDAPVVEQNIILPIANVRIKEEDFYAPFAEWIVNELEECTKAIPLGRNKFKDKWGTPDVIGIKKAKNSDIIKFSTEVVSVEIKTDTYNLITAFGQTCSYKLFSHKTYIVIPKNSSKEDIDRIDSLSLIFNIGLILFDSSNPDDPKFDIRTRAARYEPDMFYVNKYLKLIEDDLFE